MSSSSISFSFAADPHVHSERTRDWLIEDLARMRDVDFIVVGGDLTCEGTRRELLWYMEAIATSPVPVHSVFGGHDGNTLLAAGAPRPTSNYEEVVGPLWHGFDAGPARCLAYVPGLDYRTPREQDYLTPSMRLEQIRWLEEEIGRLSTGQPLLVFQHMPSTAPLPPALQEHRPLAVFSGHWHLLKTYRQGGMLCMSVPALAVTGFMGVARGFALCKLAGSDLQVTYKPLLPLRQAAVHDVPRYQPVRSGRQRVEASEDWPDFYGGSSGRRRSRSPGPALEIAWQRRLPGMTLLQSPIVVSGRVLMATADDNGDAGWLGCFDARDGSPRWEQTLEAAVWHTPAVIGGRVLALGRDGRVTALDLDGGRRLWTAGVDAGDHRWAAHGLAVGRDPAMTGPSLHRRNAPNTAYLRTPARVVAMDAATGEAVWETPFAHSDWMAACGAPLCVRGKLLVPSLLGEGLSCLDTENGRMLWSTDGERGLTRMTGGLGFSPTHGIVLATGFAARLVRPVPSTLEGWPDSFQGLLCAIRLADGHTLWESEVGPYIYSCPVVTEDTVLVSDCVTGRLLAFDVGSGSERWSFKTGPPLQCTAPDRRDSPSLSGTPAVSGHHVFFGASDGWLYTLELRTGALLDQVNLEAAIASSPALSGNALYIATCDSVLVGLVGGHLHRPDLRGGSLS